MKIDNNIIVKSDYKLNIPLGNIGGYKVVNKFGYTNNADADIECDVWDGANTTDNQPVWLAPTDVRIHAIVSDNVADDSGGVGANKIKIYGLTSWDNKEVSEIITMNGTTSVNTVNSYVIIHRMKVIPVSGQTSINTGNIKATAAIDSTVTAMILAGVGQTLMAIYGIPSTQTVLMPRYYVSAVKGSASLSIKVTLGVNPSPDIATTLFLTKNTIGISTEGSNFAEPNYNPYYKIVGPAIIKITANSSGANTKVASGFDLILKNN